MNQRQPKAIAEEKKFEDQVLAVLGKPPSYECVAANDWANIDQARLPPWLKYEGGATLSMLCAGCGEKLTEFGTVWSDVSEVMERLWKKVVTNWWAFRFVSPDSERTEPLCSACARREYPASSCPQCGCPNVTPDRRGYSVIAGIAGDLLVGPIGLLAGVVGENEIILSCTNCNHKWRAT